MNLPITLLAATLLLPTLLAAASPRLDDLDKTADTPDLMQSLPEAGLPDKGVAYCGPVSASNALVWLSRHGYPGLAPADAATPRGQGALADELGKPRYMHTTYSEGTPDLPMLLGLESYLKDHGVRGAELGYQGIQTVPARLRAGQGPLDVRWILQGQSGTSAVMLKIDWYHLERQTDVYAKFAGHWVTLVGYDPDAQGRPDPLRPIVHDPAPRSGPLLSHDHMTLVPLAHGKVKNWDGKPYAAARGRYRVGGGLHIKVGADVGLLDGAIVLRLPPLPGVAARP